MNRFLTGLLLCLLPFVTPGCARGPAKRFEDVRAIAAQKLGAAMASDLRGSGPVLLVSRDADPALLSRVEAGLTKGLGSPARKVIGVHDAPKDADPYLNPTVENTGLIQALREHPDAAAVVTLCVLRHVPTKPPVGEWPPMYAFDWSSFTLRQNETYFARGLFRGGVFQKAAPQPPPSGAGADAAFEAAFELVTAANWREKASVLSPP